MITKLRERIVLTQHDQPWNIPAFAYFEGGEHNEYLSLLDRLADRWEILKGNMWQHKQFVRQFPFLSARHLHCFLSRGKAAV